MERLPEMRQYLGTSRGTESEVIYGEGNRVLHSEQISQTSEMDS